jgi:hypothetical protein
LSCASAASFLHCWTWSWKKSEVSIIAGHHNKSPAHRGFDKPKTRQLGICSDGSKEESGRRRRPQRSKRLSLPAIAEPRIFNRLWDCRAARCLPSINHVSPWSGAWTPMRRTRTARSVAWQCNLGVRLQRIIWVPSFPVSTVTGAALCSMLRRALKFWNSPRQRSRRVNGPCVRKWYFSAAAMASVRIKTPLRTRAGRRHELRVPVTEAAQAPGRRHALLVADKAAIRASARSAPAINCAPRIVLRVGWSGKGQASTGTIS